MNTNEDGYRSEAYSFDSSGLERAARAARDLEKSKFASEALALSKEQEATKQQENMLKIKEYEVSIEQMKVEARYAIIGSAKKNHYVGCFSSSSRTVNQRET